MLLANNAEPGDRSKEKWQPGGYKMTSEQFLPRQEISNK
jgi:hypothetical protein